MPERLFADDSGATFSPCGVYRYRLWRRWDTGDLPAAFIMLNPSTADAAIDDPTIRRCIGYARRWGCGGLIVGNLFAYRATVPADMRAAADPIGPDNDRWLQEIAREPGTVICGWGAHGGFMRRDRDVLRLIAAAGATPKALSLTKSGKPAHPLYLRGDLEPQEVDVG